MGDENSDLSDVLRESVEQAQVVFSQACAPGVSEQIKQAAALNLERAIVRLNDYILPPTPRPSRLPFKYLRTTS